MDQLLQTLVKTFAANAADWLTLVSTTMLGCVTVYFAWRSRQLERRQLQQISREFDRELAEASAEIEKWRIIIAAWENASRVTGNPTGALRLFLDSPLANERPDFSRISGALAFHLPEREGETMSAMLRVFTAALFVGAMKNAAPRGIDADRAKEQLDHTDKMVRSAKEPLDVTAASIKELRARLRQLK